MTSDISSRFKLVFSQYFSGSQSRMSRHIGCSQATISLVCRGRKPGRRIIEQTAQATGIPIEWLQSGKGKLPAVIPSDGRWNLPVSRELLETPPRSAKGSIAVAEEHWSATRYWYELQPNDSVLRYSTARLRAYDHLLMETDEDMRGNLSNLDGTFCAARVLDLKDGRGSGIRLGILNFCDDPEDAHLLFSTGEESWRSSNDVKQVNATMTARCPITDRIVPLGQRSFPVRFGRDGELSALSLNEFGTIEVSIKPQDIVAVCLKVVREFPRVQPPG